MSGVLKFRHRFPDNERLQSELDRVFDIGGNAALLVLILTVAAQDLLAFLVTPGVAHLRVLIRSPTVGIGGQ